MRELDEKISELIESYIEDSYVKSVKGSDIGLDPRAGDDILISEQENWVAVRGDYSKRILEYYGGFEYVSADDKKVLGEYTFYFSESNRVRNALECFSEQEEV